MLALGGALTVLLAGLVAGLGVRAIALVALPPESTAAGRVPVLGGLPPETHARSRYHARYYAMTLLFLAFDTEMVSTAAVTSDMLPEIGNAVQ